MRKIFASLLVLALAACSDSPTISAPSHHNSTTASGSQDLSARAALLAKHDGKAMRIRIFSVQENGARLLMASLPAHLVLDRAHARLNVVKSEPLVDCSSTHLDPRLEFVHPCNSRQMANGGDPTEIPEFNEGVSAILTAASSAPPPTPVSDLPSDSIRIERFSLPDGLPDYDGNSLISFDQDNSGRIASGVVSGEGGFTAGYTVSNAAVPTFSVEILGPDGFDVEIDVGPDGLEYLRDVDLLKSGSLQMADCWTELLSAAGHIAGWAGFVGAVGYGADEMLFRESIDFTATIRGLPVSGPARSVLRKSAWATIAGVAEGAASIWEGMHNSIQDALLCLRGH